MAWPLLYTYLTPNYEALRGDDWTAFDQRPPYTPPPHPASQKNTHTHTHLQTFSVLSEITYKGVKRVALCTLMPNHMSFYYTRLVCNPCPFSCNYSREVAGGRHAVIVFEGGMAEAKIDFRCHICAEEFELFPSLRSLSKKDPVVFRACCSRGSMLFIIFPIRVNWPDRMEGN